MIGLAGLGFVSLGNLGSRLWLARPELFVSLPKLAEFFVQLVFFPFLCFIFHLFEFLSLVSVNPHPFVYRFLVLLVDSLLSEFLPLLLSLLVVFYHFLTHLDDLLLGRTLNLQPLPLPGGFLAEEQLKMGFLKLNLVLLRSFVNLVLQVDHTDELLRGHVHLDEPVAIENINVL